MVEEVFHSYSGISLRMGDAIIENVWDGEDEVDLTRVVHSDEEAESENEEAELTKSAKKKRKFEALKEKKKAALSSIVEKPQQTKKQLTAVQMLESILLNKPSGPEIPRNIEFDESDFFHPELSEVGLTVSTKHVVCPFVRALSVGLPTYKKLILEDHPGSERFGCPIVLIVCASAQRASEIIKSVSAKLIKCKIAKLYAKHFKVQEQIEMLSKEYYPIAIGTPNRLSKLIEMGSLSLKHTKIALVDITLDSKRYNILTLNEIKQDFYKLLYNDLYAQKRHIKFALINQETPVSGGEAAEAPKKIDKEAAKVNYFKKRKEMTSTKK